MPIEIRELVIKARVDDNPPANNAGNVVSMQTLSDRDLQKIVALCAEEVLKVLKRQKER